MRKVVVYVLGGSFRCGRGIYWWSMVVDHPHLSGHSVRRNVPFRMVCRP